MITRPPPWVFQGDRQIRKFHFLNSQTFRLTLTWHLRNRRILLHEVRLAAIRQCQPCRLAWVVWDQILDTN